MEGLICFCLWGLIYCLKVFGCLLGICEKGLQKLHVFHLQFRNRGTVLRLRLTKAEKLHWSKIRKLLPRLWTKTKNPLTNQKPQLVFMYVLCVCMCLFNIEEPFMLKNFTSCLGMLLLIITAV